MAILTDGEIKKHIEAGDIVITPYRSECLGSNSYDIHLGKKLAVYTDDFLDAKKPNNIKMIEIPDEGIVLEPGELYLGVTEEYTETLKHVPFLEGKSSTGRLSICLHATAGKGDVGFKGHWTLEIFVTKRVKVYHGMPIGQLIYFRTNVDTLLVPYDKKLNSKYFNQPAEPVPSKMYLNKF